MLGRATTFDTLSLGTCECQQLQHATMNVGNLMGDQESRASASFIERQLDANLISYHNQQRQDLDVNISKPFFSP